MAAGSSNAAASGGASSANASSRASPAVGTPSNAKAMATMPLNSNGYHPPKGQQLPLSAMTSAPLDLNSVERRGQPTAVREPTKRRERLNGVEEAPTYYPTLEEFKDPMEYMRKIAPEASQYGICKIVPPESWNPPFAIDTQRFHFRTRKQELNSVEGSTRVSMNYVEALVKFHNQNGRDIRLPYVDKKPLDMYRLKKAVENRGGFAKVCKSKKWAEIGRDLGYSGKIMSSLSTSLKNSYQKFLCPYEDYLRAARPGVHQQLELEYGGPLTPSPAPSPAKKPTTNTPTTGRVASPAIQASDALQETINGQKKAPIDASTSGDSEATPSAKSTAATGFTAINSGGFKAVNTGSNRTPLPGSSSATSTPIKPQPNAATSAKNTPEYRPSGLGAANSLKRQHSGDSLDLKHENGDCKDDSEGASCGRRSKRAKKENVPTVAGSHMTLFRPSLPRFPKDDSTPSTEKCHLCAKGKDSGFIVVCESCDYGYHGTCLDPPLKVKPDTEWNCPRCLVGDGRFGFEEGGLYSLRRFQEKAANFKQSYFVNKMPEDAQLKCHRPVTEDDVEKEFWRLVSSIEETVEVEYGADIHCTTHGSGFPTAEKNPDDPYSTDPWNLNLLPLHPESLFRYIKSDISGMTVPWVYVGMIFSTFCWHNEDHYSYSANYQHFGATKTWYGIPGEDAEKFEAAMREAIPELFATQPDLLFQLVTLLPPERLKKAGVRVYAIDQRAGQFVITFPQAYHAGFNHGFNFNEAVNFAPSDWEPFGLAGVERLQQFRRQPCFSHDELLWTAAEGIASGGLTIQTAKWLAPALERIHSRELTQRQAFVFKHKEASSHKCAIAGGQATCLMTFKIEDEDVAEEEYQCAFCKAYTYLSRFKCVKSGKVLCLLHAVNHACCDASDQNRLLGEQHIVYYRKAEDIIAATYKKVADKAHVPEHWEEKYDKILSEEAVPSLKSLRNLLNEGEKIPFDLPSLPMLKAFVERCNRWVEEATYYTVRKQQNRRKNEKAWQSVSRKSIGNSTHDSKEGEMRNFSNIGRLMREAEQLGFDCPEIMQLQERAEAIKQFQENAQRVLEHVSTQSVDSVEELLEEGHSFNVDIPEVESLSRVLDQLRWNQKARQKRGTLINLDDVNELIEEGKRLDIKPYNDHMVHYTEQLAAGQQWERKAQEIINAEVIHYAQLEALSQQAAVNALPVSQATLAEVDRILYKQREALSQIQDLNARCRNPDYKKRPMYSEVCEITKKIEELQSKPNGTTELEKEQRRHEDWMRKGKKLFGKTNAPLHILKSHLEYVFERNSDCFDILHDKPRVPAEPASREPSPEADPKLHRWEDPRFREVFCICRRTEAGMMIECELCHEWYHGKCLKVARGKIREDDKYTCPICDWRVPIPRDASRPNLEDLQAWYDEIPSLPFQPEEEGVLKQIIDNASEFRAHIYPYCNNLMATASEVETQRFYLRKLEGAEILLAYETNFFRAELHKWSPVAPQPPPMVEVSKSTRKPRPTKLQKLFTQYGVETVEDLPESVRGKANSLKRKALNAEAAAAAAAAAAATSSGGAAHSSGGQPVLQSPGSIHHFPGSYYPGPSSSQSSTPGVSGHGHPVRAPNAALASAPGSSHGQLGKSLLAREDPMATNGSSHSGFLGQDTGPSGPRLLIGDSGSSTSSHALEERILNGQIDEVALQNEKTKILEILGRTEAGRRQAEQLYGPTVWGGTAPAERNEEAKDGGAEVERMFSDLVNHEAVTTEALDSERNGMDALLDGD